MGRIMFDEMNAALCGINKQVIIGNHATFDNMKGENKYINHSGKPLWTKLCYRNAIAHDALDDGFIMQIANFALNTAGCIYVELGNIGFTAKQTINNWRTVQISI